MKIWCMLSCFSHVQLFATVCTVVHQAPLSMGFSRQGYRSGLRTLLQGIFLTQGSNPCLLCLLHWQTGSLLLTSPGKPQYKIQFRSVAQSCPTLCDRMECTLPGFPVHHQLLELAQTHVHWVSDAIQPSHPLLSPSPAFNFSQHHLFTNESVLHIRWPKPSD